MKTKRTLSCFLISLFFCLWTVTQPLHAQAVETSQKTNPKVVVSIPPFFALVSELLRGIDTPTLIVKQGASPHHYALSPREVQAVTSADLIFWGGPNLESFLINALKNAPSQTQIVQLDKTPGIHWLNGRTSPLFKDIPNTRDMHFWLDPDNAIRLIDQINSTLIKYYPSHKQQLIKNATLLKKDIHFADHAVKLKLKPIQSVPYLVMHDGYHYFEHHYGLNAIGSVTDHPEHPLSIERVKQIQSLILSQHIVCIFSEPGVQSKLLNSLVKQFNLKTAELDALERPNQSGEYSYPKTLESLADTLVSCLGQTESKIQTQSNK